MENRKSLFSPSMKLLTLRTTSSSLISSIPQATPCPLQLSLSLTYVHALVSLLDFEKPLNSCHSLDFCYHTHLSPVLLLYQVESVIIQQLMDMPCLGHGVLARVFMQWSLALNLQHFTFYVPHCHSWPTLLMCWTGLELFSLVDECVGFAVRYSCVFGFHFESFTFTILAHASASLVTFPAEHCPNNSHPFPSIRISPGFWFL